MWGQLPAPSTSKAIGLKVSYEGPEGLGKLRSPLSLAFHLPHSPSLLGTLPMRTRWLQIPAPNVRPNPEMRTSFLQPSTLSAPNPCIPGSLLWSLAGGGGGMCHQVRDKQGTVGDQM